MLRHARSLLASLLVCGSIALVTAAAQAPARPADAPAPNPLGQPLLDADGHVREDAFFKVPLLPEDRKYADLDGLKMKAVLREAAAISQKDKARGTQFWGRNVGTQGHVDTQEWVEGYLKKNGLKEVHRKSFELTPQWMAKSFDISFSSAGQPLKLVSARPAEGGPSTPAGASFDIVWVNTGTTADF